MNSKIDKILSRPDRVFRLAGLLSCAIIGMNTIFVHLYGNPGADMLGLVDVLLHHSGVSASRQLMIFVDLIVFPAFGWAFWRNLDADRLLAPRRISVALLALQSALGLLFSTALFFTVAAEVCFILSTRAAFFWVLAQMVAGVALVFAMPREALMQFTAGAGSAPPPAVTLLMQCLMYPMILSFSYCLGLLAATEWRNRLELARVNAELNAMQKLQAESARLAERLHISRELHDTVGHHLAALSLNLQLAGRLSTDDAAEHVREAHLVARTLLADVRDVVGALRQDPAVDFVDAISTLAAGVKRPAVHLDITDDLRGADPLEAHTLFRCVQEIITNAMRHSSAENLQLKLQRDGGGALLLEACDDGRGVESIKPGNGLKGMRERVEEYGGKLSVKSSAGGGFSLSIRLPVNQESS